MRFLSRIYKAIEAARDFIDFEASLQSQYKYISKYKHSECENTSKSGLIAPLSAARAIEHRTDSAPDTRASINAVYL